MAALTGCWDEVRANLAAWNYGTDQCCRDEGSAEEERSRKAKVRRKEATQRTLVDTWLYKYAGEPCHNEDLTSLASMKSDIQMQTSWENCRVEESRPLHTLFMCTLKNSKG